MIRRPLNIAALTISFVAIGILTIVAFIGAYAYDEGTTDSTILPFLFKVLRFPTHTFFWDFFNRTAPIFYSGLLLNTAFYALLTERLFSFLKGQNRH